MLAETQLAHNECLSGLALITRVVPSTQSQRNGFKNAVDIGQHIVVPKSQDAIAVIDEPAITDTVMLAVHMLTAVDLDDKSSLATNEVCNIRSDRLLPNEFEPIDRARSQPIPKLAFGIG